MSSHKKNTSTILFVFVLCLVAAVLLAVVSTALIEKQEEAKSDFLIKQLLISARILSTEENFELIDQQGNFLPAIYDGTKLVVSKETVKASMSQIKKVYLDRVHPKLTNSNGEIFTFEELGLNYGTYFDKHKKEGFSHLEYKLFYEIEENGNPSKKYGYTFPVSGFGLWDAIHALITVESDCTTILGFSCYDQKETPGLGGEISEDWWQKQFYQKKIFREAKDGKINFAAATLGIDVVKPGKMSTLNKHQKRSSVDGVTGASITSDGIMQAIRNSLAPYRPLLIKLREEHDKNK